MKLSVSSTIEFLGILALVVSLGFVAYELRQSNEIALVEAVGDLYGKFNDINQFVASEPELAELLVRSRAAESWEAFTPAERLRLESFHRFLFNTWLTADIAYKRGKLPDFTHKSIFEDIRFAVSISGPALQEWWYQLLDTYPSNEDSAVAAFMREELDRQYGGSEH